MRTKRFNVLTLWKAVFCWMVVIGVGAVSTGCSIDDEDRCSGDFVWNGTYKSCECPEGTEWTGTGNDCTDPVDASVADDAGISGDAGDAGDETPTGLGEACEGDSCAELEANICVPQLSYCSTTCDPQISNGCAGGYSCCSCSAGDICLKPTDVSLAESTGTCTCE